MILLDTNDLTVLTDSRDAHAMEYAAALVTMDQDVYL